jgi:hypothetical protein
MLHECTVHVLQYMTLHLVLGTDVCDRGVVRYADRHGVHMSDEVLHQTVHLPRVKQAMS